jgi:hypothetical protein
MRDTDEDIIRDHDKGIEEGTELEGYRPIRGRVSKNLSVSYALRLSPDEYKQFDDAARSKGMNLAEFFRASARAAMAGDLDAGKASAAAEV